MDEYSSFDATALAELVARGEVSPKDLAEAAIARIERANPKLNAVVTRTYERALATAAELPQGPFRGVPFLIKDLFASDAGVRMTGGCRALSSYVPESDTELVRRYKEAGLNIVGRTNTPEFGIPPTTESEALGPCHNPWNLDHSTGGSSGGAAAAVAARLVPAAHASDGGGSIRIPASCCGIFGLKPTRGRNPLGPDIAQSVAGLVAEHVVSISVRDSAALLDVTGYPETGAPYVAPSKERPFADELGRRGAPLRIAVMKRPRNGADVDPECIAAVDRAARLCAALGHHVEEDAYVLEDVPSTVRAFVTVWSLGVAVNVDAAGRMLGRAPRSEDFEPMTWALAEMGRAYTGVDVVLAERTLNRVSRRIGEFFERYDVLITPTLARPPVPLGELVSPEGEPLRAFAEAGGYAAFTPDFNVTGQPAMSVPLHWTDNGLPVGVQFAGRYGAEGTLFRLAAQLEEAAPWAQRRPPVTGEA
jgi:amidase